ncbi:tetratricopeptide repeat protein 7B [Lepeophtheirus salmonis]|uniref:tetratricopeptide repeat protein 7B n=1 Tax=Lepeophtheirus salmonis TaxID=72036 RepID=UPI001AE84496|nr:tetratricopeptide repeat protein 7B-like [Lepeophtheirus salmonis]
MTSTRSGHKRLGASSAIEIEIERSREESNWKRIVDLAEQVKQRPDKQFETLASFLIGEGKLEEFLEENPPKETNIPKAKTGLQDAKQCLNRTIGEEAKKLGVHLDSFILLGKIHFAQGLYNEALKYYEKAQLDMLEEKALPPRSLKIIAEAFAIKGLCYEKIPLQNTSKHKSIERENNILRFYELAADLTLLFLQTADRASSTAGYGTGTANQSTWSVTSVGTGGSSSSPIPSFNNVQHKLGYILETVLLKAPALCIRSNDINKAINRFRTMLFAEESESTKSIRQNVCKQLSETLLQQVSDVAYHKPEVESSPQHQKRTASRNYLMDSPWKPRKHAVQSNSQTQVGTLNDSSIFHPRSRIEEIVLLLLIAEYLASKEAVLSQSPEFRDTRKRTYHNATVIYDILSVTLSRFSQFHLLSDVLERSMKFSFGESHSWTQFALNLAAEGQYYRAVIVYRQVAHLNDEEVGPSLVMARLCYEKLARHDEGLDWSKRALSKDKSGLHKGRCNVYLGIGYSLLSYEQENEKDRNETLNLASNCFENAVKFDPNDHLAEFYLAYHSARRRRIHEASDRVRRALKLQPDHLASLHLFILLLSASGEREAALELTTQTLEEYPDSIALMTLKVNLEEVVKGPSVAILTVKKMLSQWQNLNYDQNSFTKNPSSSSAYDALSDKDSVSLHAQSITASHIERTLSEVASSLSSSHQFISKENYSSSSYAQMRIWLLAAELHLHQGNVEAADLCVNEAKQISPLNHHIMYVKGLINEKIGELSDAQQCFENCLGVNPSFINGLYYLAKVYTAQGYHRLAEQTLKTGLRLDPNNESLWRLTGEVTEAIALEIMESYEDEPNDTVHIKEESESTPSEESRNFLLEEAKKLFSRSSNCHAISLSVQTSSPILPFTTIPLVFE